jgi:YHS domain-containing protein
MWPCTYQVRGNQLVIIPAYYPPNKPGFDVLNPVRQQSVSVQEEEDVAFLDVKKTHMQIYGGVVNILVEKRPLPEILADLRTQTRANIVLDPRCQAQVQKANLSITLNDVRLYDAVRVIADMAELKMVYAGNVYYVTTPENAKVFFPPPPPAKQFVPLGVLGGVGGGFGGSVPQANPAPPAPMQKEQ